MNPNSSIYPCTQGPKIWIKWLTVRWWYGQAQVCDPQQDTQGDFDEKGLGILRIVLLQKPGKLLWMG